MYHIILYTLYGSIIFDILVTADSAGLPGLRQLPSLPRLPPLQAGQEVGGRQPRHVLQ